MDHDKHYFQALATARELVVIARTLPDAPEHVLLAHFVYAVLAALADEAENAAVKTTKMTFI
jgi:hypothetical protein